MSWAEYDELFRGNDRDLDWASVGFDTSLPVIDVGPGTGRDLLRLARALPAAEIIAVEPDEGMRAVLATRLAMDDDLLARVSVLADPVGRAPLPPRCGGVVATGVLYFMAPAERSMLWRRAHAALASGGVVVIDTGDAPHPAQAERPRLMQVRNQGRWRYERWFSQRPLPHGEVEIVNEVRVFEGERVLRVECDRRRTYVLPDVLKRREAREAGFDVEPSADGRHVLARRR